MEREISSLRPWPAGLFGSPRWLAAAVAVAALSALFLVWQGARPCDDAYITFRHVRNLVELGAPSWNPDGPPVLGSTSPAYIFVLGAAARVTGSTAVPQIALLLNASLHFLIVLLAFAVTHDLARDPRAALLAAALVGANAMNVIIFSQGFENGLLLALILGATLAVRRGKDATALLLASVAPLVRPEGVIVSALVLGYLLVARRLGWRSFALFLAIPLVWLVGSTLYYGSPVPQPIRAKKLFPAIYRPYTGEEVDLLRRLPALPLYTGDLVSGQAAPLLLTGSFGGSVQSVAVRTRAGVAMITLALLAWARVRQPDGRLVHLLYPLLFLLLYAWIGQSQPWYFPSFITTSLILLSAGLAGLLDRLSRLAGIEQSTGARWKVAGCYLLAFLLFVTANGYTFTGYRGMVPGTAPLVPRDARGPVWDRHEWERLAVYRDAAQQLNQIAGADDSVLISEVGVFGYYYRGPVIDSVGLCSPEALSFYPPPRWDIFDPDGAFRTPANNFVPTEMVSALRPAFIVNSRVYILNLLQRPEFRRRYEEQATLGQAWGEPVTIFRRRPQATPGGSIPLDR